MESKKTSKKTNKIAEQPAVSVTENITDSKPVNRGRTAARKQEPLSKASTPSTSNASHRHSKVNVPAMAVVEEIVSQVVVAAPAPINHVDIARLAYFYWEERGFAHGSAEEDWHRAVKALGASAS